MSNNLNDADEEETKPLFCETINMKYGEFKNREKLFKLLKNSIIADLEEKYDALDASRANDEYSFCHLEGYATCLKDVIELIKEK